MRNKVIRWLRSNPQAYALARRIAELRGYLPPIRVEGLPGRIHRNDLMALDRQAYAESSRLHFAELTSTLDRVGWPWDKIQSFIDYGCGYGRVTRWLPSVLEPEKIIACDIDPAAVRWCRNEYKVRGAVLQSDPSANHLPPGDALFACSVLTHLSRNRILAFLKFLTQVLSPGGVAVVTGKSVESAQNAHLINAHLDGKLITKALSDEGFYFCAYPHSRDREIGDTYFTADWLASVLPPSLSILACHPRQFWSHDGYVIGGR